MCSTDVKIDIFIFVNIHFIHPHLRYSLTIEHIGPILSLAAATSNVDMRNACIAKLSVDTDRMLSIPAIWENLSEEQLNCLLTKPELRLRGGEFGLRVVCSWIDGGKANNELQERLDRFKLFLELVDLTSITEGVLLNIIRSDYAVTESKLHR